ncbi:MAG: ATP-binding protein, partial [Candidatus Aminicenantes bacterium]|nr:ATP-binding protein [Candidatus Aminicenantes bacterium]
MTKPKVKEYREINTLLNSKKPGREFNIIPNPYNPYDLESGQLFYRKDVIEKIRGIFNSTLPQRLIVIQGYRGSGKTSTLRKMVDEPVILGERFLPVYLRLSEIENLNLENFLSFINKSIIKVMENLRLKTDDIFIPGTSMQETMRLIETFEAVAGNDKVVVFIFDDVERIQRANPTDEKITDIFALFQFLLQGKDISRLVLAGEGQIVDWLKAPGQNEFLKIDALIDLEVFLNDKVLESFIVDPVERYVQYKPEAIRRIIEVTGGNLYCQQLLCFYIVRHLNKTQKNVCSTIEVEQAIKNVINDKQREDFTYFWGKMPFERKIVFSALADDSVIKKEGTYHFIKETTLLNNIFQGEELKNILKRLIDDRYINKMSGRRFDGAPYRVPLFGEWVKTYHSFPQTMVGHWEAVTKRVPLAHLSEIMKTIPANSLPLDYKTANNIISLSEAWRSLRNNMKNRRFDRENIEEIIKICCAKLEFKIIGTPENGKTFFLIDTSSLNLSGLDETRLFFFTSEEPDDNEIHNIQEKIQHYASQSSFFSFLICIRATNVIKELIHKEHLGIIFMTEDDLKKIALSPNPIQVFKEDIIKPQVRPSRISKYQTQGPATITFYGRHDEIGKILGAEKQNFAIVGARKIGKTS